MSGERSDPTILEAAAGWMARLRADDADADDRVAFERWLAQDGSNRRAYRSVVQAWEAAGDLASDARIRTLHAGAGVNRAGSRIGRRTAAAGALIAAGLATVLLLPRVSVPLPSRITDPLRRAVPADVRSLETQVGQQATARFSDGTIVRLNTDTLLRVPRWDRERRVELVRGEARFNVARNPNKPFSVLAQGRRVIALGTTFDVRLDEREVSVTLVEGRVRVDPVSMVDAPEHAARERAAGSGAGTVMIAGSRLVAPSTGRWRVARIDTARASDWTRRQLLLNERPLAEAVREMNRYSEIKLRVAGPELGTKPVSGVFQAGRVEEFAAALKAYGLVRVARPSPDVIELRPAS